MNAIQVLLKDHEEIRSYFRQMEEASKGAKQTKRKIAEQVIKELQSHTQMEERIFYPAVLEKAKGELHDLVLEGIEEHRVAEFMMQRLEQAEPGDQWFDARFTVLVESVEHHIKEEEKTLFPESKKLLADDLDRLGQELEALHKQLEG
jgi:hemerythrin-like domain-containing protein